MADVIKEFLVEVGFKVDKSSFNKFNDNISKAGKALAGLGIVVAAKKLNGFVREVAEGFDATQQLGTRVNATAKEIMELGFAASVSGSSVEAVNRSFEGLNRAAGEAATGVGRGAMAFRQLGIEARKQDGTLKKTSELMEDIGNKIKDMTKQEQVAILAKVGIDPTLLNVLTSDANKLKREFDDLYDKVGIDANKAAKSSEAFNDSLTRMNTAFDAVRKAIALRFMPEITRGMDSLRKTVIQNAPDIIASLQPILNGLLKITQSAFILSAHTAVFFKKLDDATGGWSTKIIAATAAWKLLNKAFLSSPIGKIIALGTAIGLVVDDFVVWKNGGKSLIDWANAFDNSLKVLIDTLGTLRGMLSISLNNLKESFLGSFFPSEEQSKINTKSVKNLSSLRNGQTVTNLQSGFNPGLGILNPKSISTNNYTTPTINQNNNITVNGSPSPQMTSRDIAREIKQVNADLARNMSGQIR